MCRNILALEYYIGSKVDSQAWVEMSYNGFIDSLAALKKYIPALMRNENVLWDKRDLYKGNQMFKWIELIYDLREIKHMFHPYILFSNSVNSSLELHNQWTKECVHVKQPLIADFKPRFEPYQTIA